MIGLAAFVVLMPTGQVVVQGADVKLIASKIHGCWEERLYARDHARLFRLVLESPAAMTLNGSPQSGSIQGAERGLYHGVPDLYATELRTVKAPKDTVLILTAQKGPARFVKRVHIPRQGRDIKLEFDADFGVARTQIHALLMSYAFAPDGKPLSKGGGPDSTFLPGLRPRDDNVCGDHFFRAPAAVAQQGKLAALLMPDLDVLAANRPIETVLDLDAKNGVCDATLLTYGFCAHRLTGHVNYGTDTSMVRNVPGQLHLAADLILNADAEPFGAYREAAAFEWARYGHRYFDKVKPQMRPFADYAKECYPAVFDQHDGNNKVGWFEVTIDGHECGGIPSGWGWQEGWVSWQCWFNQIRSAWGLHWWGLKLGNRDWIDKSNKMLNLALAAPIVDGLCPTTYDSRNRKWIGCLVTPDSRCYYDLTNIAWKGIWLLRWLDFPDCPRREEIVRQTSDMAKKIAWRQNADGSFPTWLDQNTNPLPILDHSAQTALPVWFMADILAHYKAETAQTKLYTVDKPGTKYLPGIYIRHELGPAVLKGARFLAKNVVRQQRYYDFETFFSCSPKRCLQRNGVIDDTSMHDPHTLLPPQNTLSMQWTAEALVRTSDLLASTDPGTGKPDPERPRFVAAALDALEMMALYQNVWPISYRKAAYTYGGFGVQNSDGEYDDARQAQFGCTLCDFGVRLGRQDLFERGVAAARASLTLINDPLHAQEGIYPNPNYPLGLEPENDGHGGVDEQDGRSGTDWGESSGLTSMAWLLDHYGQAYEDQDRRWRVGIDGVVWHPSMDRLGEGVFSGSLQPRREIEVRSNRGSARKLTTSLIPREPGPAFVTSTDGEKPGWAMVTEMLFPIGNGATGEFVSARGERVKARISQSSDWGGDARAEVPLSFLAYPVHFEGVIAGWPFKTEPTRHYFDPTFKLSADEMSDWQVDGDFADIPTISSRRNFGLSPGEPFIGTAEDGHGGYDDRYTGAILSPYLWPFKNKIKLLVGGGAGDGTYVELLAYHALPPGGANDPGERVFIARGENSERMREVVWDVSKLKKNYLRIRIVDRETGGWGHINVARIRCSD